MSTTYSEIQITFNTDVTIDPPSPYATIAFAEVSDGEVFYPEYYVTTRSASTEVTTGTPTGTPGETSAINYAIAFNLDYNGLGLFEITQVLNVVTIKTVGWVGEFEQRPSPDSDITVSITNVDPNPAVFIKYDTILSRSPYFVYAPIYNGSTTVEPLSCQFDIRVWSGDIVADKPIDANYVLNKSARFLTDTHIFVNIADIINDFITQQYNGTLTSNAIFVEVEALTTHSGGFLSNTTIYTSLDGYGGQQQGVNPILNDLLLSNSHISVLSGKAIEIPFITQGSSYTIDFRNGTTIESTDSITAAELTDTSNLVEVISYVPTDVNNVKITNTVTLEEVVLSVEIVEECVYEPIKCTFLNKQGVLQNFYFYKSNKESLSASSESYNANILNESIVNNRAVLNYDTTSHRNKKYNTKLNKSISINSGYIDEDNNIVIEELIASEYVWLTINDVIYPVDLDTKSIEYLTRLNDQLIKYNLKFKYSFDVIQNVR